MEREAFIRQLLPVVTRDLLALRYQDAEAAAIAKHFLEKYVYLETVTPSRTTFGLLVEKYAIRKEDINLLVVVARAATGASGGFFASLNAALHVKVVALFALFSTVRELRRTGRALPQEQVRILAILKECAPAPTAPGLTAEELLQLFNLESPAKDLEWMARALEELRALPLPGSSTRQLISERGGRWRSHV